MKRLILALLAIAASSSAWGSGCGSYTDFRVISETRDDSSYAETWISILVADRQYAKIRRATGELSLEFESQYSYDPGNDSNQPRLKRRDLRFAEGNGCGPVYDCITGQYILYIPDEANKMMTVYSYPRIDEFEQYPSERVSSIWKADLVIPTMLGLSIEGDPSDKKQCVWGYW